MIDRYNMICSTGGGEIDERGRFNPVSQSEKRDGCAGGLRTGNVRIITYVIIHYQSRLQVTLLDMIHFGQKNVHAWT